MVHLFPSCWFGAEIKCTVHACCSVQITHKLGDQQSRQQALRDYCPNIYTVFKGDEEEIEKQSRRLVKGDLVSESIFHFVSIL